MKNICFYFGLAFVLLVCSTNALNSTELAVAITKIIEQPQYARMEWGIFIESQITGDRYSTVYEMNSEQYFTPASNNKVITTAPAYLFFGNDFRFQTPLIADSEVTSELNQVCLLGRGDSSLTMLSLESLALDLQAQGVSKIDSLVYDDSYYPSFPPAWEWEDVQDYYGAQPNGLVLTQNAITITIVPGSSANSPVSYSFESDADTQCMGVVNNAITVSGVPDNELIAFYRLGDSRIYLEGELSLSSSSHSYTFAALQPADRFQCVMNYYLSQHSIDIKSSSVGKCHNSSSWSTIGTITSEYALIDTMNYTLQESDNLFAEGFLRALGANYPNPNNLNAEQNGFYAVKDILNTIGVNTTTFVQDDGSGLSRHNLVSPRAMADVLEKMDSIPYGHIYYRTFLPVAGESGTLSSRFVGTPAQGIVEAKTGTMSGVSSLSGYVDESDNYPQIVFSIITNFSDKSASVAREGIDDIVVLLTQLTNDSS